MWAALDRFVHASADYAGIVGVIISVVGFYLTLVSVRKTRSRLIIQASLSDLSRIMREVEELRLFHRVRVWDALPSRYAALRRSVFAVKTNTPGLSRQDKSALQGIIQQLMDVEQIVENAVTARTDPDDIGVLNRIASEQGDKLNAILVKIQRNVSE